jgi:hypothetical protein
VAHVRLQPIKRQDDTARRFGYPLEPKRISQRQRHKFVIALQEMQDRPGGNRDAAPRQLVMDFGHTAVRSMA